MVALFSFLTIIILSITVVRIGAIAFELTGLTPEVSAFQAQSAFSGTGFTTTESESIVTHPVRRKIARVLILLGTAGFSSAIATFILTFVGQSQESMGNRVFFLFAGMVLIYIISRSKVIYRLTKRVITDALERFTPLRILDYQEVLGMQKGFTVCRMLVVEDSWLVGKKLMDLKPHLGGVLILSIQRSGGGESNFIGAPNASTEIRKGDLLTCYGPSDAIRNLSEPSKEDVEKNV